MGLATHKKVNTYLVCCPWKQISNSHEQHDGIFSCLWFTKCVYSDQWPHGHGHIRLVHTSVCPSNVCWQEPVTSQDIPDRNSSVTAPGGDVDDSLLKTTVLTVRLQNWEDWQKNEYSLRILFSFCTSAEKNALLSYDHSWNGYHVSVYCTCRLSPMAPVCPVCATTLILEYLKYNKRVQATCGFNSKPFRLKPSINRCHVSALSQHHMAPDLKENTKLTGDMVKIDRSRRTQRQRREPWLEGISWGMMYEEEWEREERRDEKEIERELKHSYETSYIQKEIRGVCPRCLQRPCHKEDPEYTPGQAHHRETLVTCGR